MNITLFAGMLFSKNQIKDKRIATFLKGSYQLPGL
jgi:hypothetical protein